MTFCVIEKIHEINLYLFNCNSYFSKKNANNDLTCSRNHWIITARFFRPKRATTFDKQNNNIRAETHN